jgi:hypothetical protein
MVARAIDRSAIQHIEVARQELRHMSVQASMSAGLIVLRTCDIHKDFVLGYEFSEFIVH